MLHFLILYRIFSSLQRERKPMPRRYTRKPGSRYKVYSDDTIKDAIEQVRSKTMSLRQASRAYGVSKSVLGRRVRNLQTRTPGGQPTLSTEFERDLIHNIVVCADWGYPMDLLDVRLFVKTFLDSRDIRVKKFKCNLPGKDWALSFLARHPELSQRLTANTKRGRAEVCTDVINEYFDNLQEALQGIPLSNILNYDETAFVDDPGSKKCLVRRGCKHPDRVLNATKSSTSVMFCASADGTVLPPYYVVYKSKGMWHNWMIGGPQNARYNRTPSGWFDSSSFSDRFFKVAFRYMRRLPGKKAIIGDNLASHL